MTVYIELVIFNNLSIDLLLEVATLTLFRRKIVWWRLLLGAIVGTAVATVYPLCPLVAQIVIRVLLAPVMALIFDRLRIGKGKGKGNIKRKQAVFGYLKRLFVFCVLTYFVGGITYGINFALGIDVASYWQLGIVAMSALCMLIAVRMIVMRFSKHARRFCNVNVVVGGVAKTLTALCDSGNALVDTLSGLPIIILSTGAERDLALSDDMLEGFAQVSTVNSEGSLPLVRLEKVSVEGKEYKAYAALARKDFEDFDLILQNTMF